MNVILEVIMEIFVEAGIEASRNKKVPKLIRWVLLTAIFSFFLLVGTALIIFGIKLLKPQTTAGLIFLALGVLMFIYVFLKFRGKI